MSSNNEIAQKKEELINERNRAIDLIKYLEKFTDVTKVPDPIIRKPIIDKIWDLVKEIQGYAEKLAELEEDVMD